MTLSEAHAVYIKTSWSHTERADTLIIPRILSKEIKLDILSQIHRFKFLIEISIFGKNSFDCKNNEMIRNGSKWAIWATTVSF